jgi:hypothetical protein
MLRRAEGVRTLDLYSKEVSLDTRRRLLDWYGARKNNPYAQEIAAWLRGDYLFDPQCLTE